MASISSALRCAMPWMRYGSKSAGRTRRRRESPMFIIARMTPALSYLIPWFIMFRAVGLNNTLTALVITHLVIGLPVVIWVMVGFFDGLPRDLDEAAAVDGASPWQAFWRITLPLIKPGNRPASRVTMGMSELRRTCL